MEGGHPLSSVRPSRMACRRVRGGTPNQEGGGGAPPKQLAPLAHGMQKREGGGTPNQDRERGVPPNQERALFMHGLIQ